MSLLDMKGIVDLPCQGRSTIETFLVFEPPQLVSVIITVYIIATRLDSPA